MSTTQLTPDREQAFFKALDQCNAVYNTEAYTRFSNYAKYRIALDAAGSHNEPCPCPWRDASDICMLLRGAALEWCGSPHHAGATVKLFSQIGASYWASKLAIEHLSQFA
jgi:hypothetical protein